jgi:hypothetical protein
VVTRAAIGLFAAVLFGTTGSATARTQELFRFTDPQISEASGIALGQVSPGVYYVQNDGGGGNRIYAVNRRSGATAATITVRGARNVDWEDIAAAPDAFGTSSLWLADIGDNDAGRGSVTVYRIVEPRIDPAARDRAVQVSVAQLWRLRYQGGPVDAESLAVDGDGRAYIVTKAVGSARVYRLPAQPDGQKVQLLRPIARITLRGTGTSNPFGSAGQLTVTGASISPHGALFAVRTYADAWIWRLGGTPLWRALRRDPVVVPLPRQPQGEGIAVLRRGLVVDSERAGSAVYRLPLPASLLRPAGPPTPPATPAPAPSIAPSPVSLGEHEGSSIPVWVVVVAIAAMAAAAVAGVRSLRPRS